MSLSVVDSHSFLLHLFPRSFRRLPSACSSPPPLLKKVSHPCCRVTLSHAVAGSQVGFTLFFITFSTSSTSLTLLIIALPAQQSCVSSPAVAEDKIRQESIYHCRPKIREQVAARKAKPRHGAALPSALDKQFFLGNAFEDQLPAELSCVKDAEEAKMRNHTCVLTPVVTRGPYYHDCGHPIRQNMAEDQLGLPFFVDVGVIDVNNCESMEEI